MQVAKTEIRTPDQNRSPESDSYPARWHRLSDFEASFQFGNLIFGLLVLLLSCTQLGAQPYSINWHTIDGGGGTSTGGVYFVSGTIGQPDAGGPMTNGPYSVTGGFWTLPTAIQMPGAPTLTIAAAAPGHATISWMPDTGTNWVLQQTAVLSPANWTHSPSGWTNPVVVPATLPQKFHRLHQP